MRGRWLLLAAGVATLGIVASGAFLLLSGRGTGHVVWTRLDEAPPGAGSMGTDAFDGAFVDALRAAAPGEGGLFVTRRADRFWGAVREAGAVPTGEGCLAVVVEGIPVELCEGPLV